MFIIWGSATRSRTVREGAFYCPHCRAHTPYQEQVVKEYFTLFFVPVFPTSTLDELIACQQCGFSFPLWARDRTAEEVEALQKPWTCAACSGLNPPSEMHCLNCKTHRPREPIAAPTGPVPASADTVALRDTAAIRPPPAQAPPPQPPNRAVADSGELADLMARRKCPACGKHNSLAALHCRSCGVRLNEQGNTSP